MGKVTIIPAKRVSGNTVSKEEHPKLRVAAYCRVSTDSDEQETSYEAQVNHYTHYIDNNPAWMLAGIYADDGISGTNTKNRVEFNRMIDECMAGKIDMIITKSISRFARNTLDCLKYIRKLKEKNIPVYFEKENINTMDAKGEVLITIMASLAQQESQSLSQNVKLGIQYRYQQGKVMVNHNWFLGYTKDSEGNLVIDPEQAKTVKRIYREFLDGKTMKQIAVGLEADGLPTGSGKKSWNFSNIRYILTNEKYIGDALLQRTVTTDFLTKKRVKNNGILPQYYVENDHPAIIPREIFMQVQAEIIRRRHVYYDSNGKPHRYSNNTCFSQMVFCGECHEIYRRIHWYIKDNRIAVWRCLSKLEKGFKHTCTNRTLKETELYEASIKAINSMITDKDEFLNKLQKNIAEAVTSSSTLTPEGLSKRLDELQEELIKNSANRSEYDAVADEIFRIREQKSQAEIENLKRNERIRRIKELQAYIKNQSCEITEIDDRMVRRLISKITVFPDHLTIEFKSGISVDIND